MRAALPAHSNASGKTTDVKKHDTQSSAQQRNNSALKEAKTKKSPARAGLS
jgi:hypothetical protein